MKPVRHYLRGRVTLAMRCAACALMLLTVSGCATSTVVSDFCTLALLPPVHRESDAAATIAWLDDYRAVYDVSCQDG